MIDNQVHNILAVDNEPHMLKLLERIIIEKTPHRMVTTSNSLEIPEILEKSRYSLIITDLKMPGMDGIDILDLVKKSDRNEEVIIITAFASLDTATKALELGVFDYIMKPFRKEQILSAVLRALHWNNMKTEYSRLNSVFIREPYQSAFRAFENEYIMGLMTRCGEDISEIGRRSGLDEARIREIIDRSDQSTD